MKSILSKIRLTQLEKWRFSSSDSAPQGYALNRKPFICPLFLFMFSIITIVLLSLPNLSKYYALLLSEISGINISAPNTLQFRLFFIAFTISYGFFIHANWQSRIKLVLIMNISCFVTILISDSILTLFYKYGYLYGAFSLLGNLISGYLSVLVIGLAIMRHITLPDTVIVKPVIKNIRIAELKFFLALLVTIFIIFCIFNYCEKQINFLRDIALLGGLGPGLTLFNPLLMIVLFMFNIVSRSKGYKATNYPNVAFLVAALNEEEQIGDCIHSLDNAAVNYPGITSLYLVDNGSRDKTMEIAKQEMEKCKSLKVILLICPEPGKSKALNSGLKNITEEITIRVDADTIVKDDILLKTVPYFNTSMIGGVSGIPLPKGESTFIGKLRAIEVYYNVGFKRLCQSAVDSVMVLPGIMSAYRTSLLKELDGFVEGLNGEDADLTIRIGRLGYKIVVDPQIIVYSEAPKSLTHLREQRLRWSRSNLHVFARNKSSIKMLQGVRGLWFLPMGFFGTFRRVIIIPLVLFALIVFIMDPTLLHLRHGASILAVIIGPTFTLVILVLLLYRRIDLIAYVPFYQIFFAFKIYITLEMLFTIPLKTIYNTPLTEQQSSLETAKV